MHKNVILYRHKRALALPYKAVRRAAAAPRTPRLVTARVRTPRHARLRTPRARGTSINMHWNVGAHIKNPSKRFEGIFFLSFPIYELVNHI